MKNARSIVALAGLVLVVALAVKLTAQHAASGPSIVGNYVLESRDLPDGKQVRPPEVQGMMTFTADRRNFNIYWQQDGKPVSISTISKYTLSPTEFSEECSYSMMNDGSSGKPPTYETTPSSGKSPVKIDGDKIEVQLPLHGEPKCVFDKSGLTATREGAFVDHWKKVD
jgi:hypothetical protein